LLGREFRRGDTPSSGPTGAPVSVDWSAVHPMPVNPKSADYPQGSRTRDAIDCFNGAYCDLLQLLERTFNGLPMLLKHATGEMYGLKQWMINLMAMDFDGNSIHAGPSFEWVPPEERVFPGTQIWVLPRGPYVMRGDIEVFDADGSALPDWQAMVAKVKSNPEVLDAAPFIASQAARCAMVSVLPVPAPATTSKGPACTPLPSARG